MKFSLLSGGIISIKEFGEYTKNLPQQFKEFKAL
jgi:hypothetical protein